MKGMFSADAENIACLYARELAIDQLEENTVRNVFVLMLMLLAIPLNAFAFDIRGWWQLEEMPSIFMKINEEKIY